MSKKSIVDKTVTVTVDGITLKVDTDFADDFEIVSDLSSGDDSRAIKGFSAMFDAICKTKKREVLTVYAMKADAYLLIRLSSLCRVYQSESTH